MTEPFHLDEGLKAIYEHGEGSPGLDGLAVREYLNGTMRIDQFVDGVGHLFVALSADQAAWLKEVLTPCRRSLDVQPWDCGCPTCRAEPLVMIVQDLRPQGSEDRPRD